MKPFKEQNDSTRDAENWFFRVLVHQFCAQFAAVQVPRTIALCVIRNVERRNFKGKSARLAPQERIFASNAETQPKGLKGKAFCAEIAGWESKLKIAVR